MNQTMLPFSFLFSVVSGWLIEYVYPPLIFLSNPPTHPPTYLLQVRTLDGSYTVTPPQAKEAVLAFLRAPGLKEDYGEESAVAFSRLAFDQKLKARVFGKEGGALLVALYDGEGSKVSLNQKLVEEGLARVSKRADRVVGYVLSSFSLSLYPPTPPTSSLPNQDQPTNHPPTYTTNRRLGVPAATSLVDEMKEAQEVARKGRLGMWRWGDVADSDDEGYGF